MKYIVHYIGEWKKNPNGFGDPTFVPPYTKEYSNLDDIEMFFRFYFNDMLNDEQRVLHTGAYVFQIRTS
jgi:hypothetical protein